MLRLSRHGTWEMMVGALVLLALGAGLAWVWWPLALPVLPVLAWLIAFFRDPDRPIPQQPEALVSPADGTVTDIETVEEPLLGGKALRIGIFLSVFDVHVNRSPCAGVVGKLVYRKGKFINALRHATASAENESNTLVLHAPGDAKASGPPIAAVKQIVGLIARRIICDPVVFDRVERGQRIGLIKFGSRTELSVPLWREPVATVEVGQKVRGAADVLCTVSVAAAAPAPEGAMARAGREP
jgi:phosphatidylserine decarboxylase